MKRPKKKGRREPTVRIVRSLMRGSVPELQDNLRKLRASMTQLTDEDEILAHQRLIDIHENEILRQGGSLEKSWRE